MTMTSLPFKTRVVEDVLNLDRLESRLSDDARAFAAAHPFPHIVLDQFLEPDACERLLAEAEQPATDKNWLQYAHYNQLKQGIRDQKLMGPDTRAVLDALASPRFIAWLEKLSGIQGLLWDPELDGGGLHKIERGGFLNMHTDLEPTDQSADLSQQGLEGRVRRRAGAMGRYDDREASERRSSIQPLSDIPHAQPFLSRPPAPIDVSTESGAALARVVLLSRRRPKTSVESNQLSRGAGRPYL